MDDKQLVYYGGQGYDYSDENGVFEIKAREIKIFYRFSEAKQYYDSLNESKALWDITSIPELIECHTFE